MTEDKNCSFYYELCLLKALVESGYLSEEAYTGIAQIAAEDLGATLYTGCKKICLNG